MSRTLSPAAWKRVSDLLLRTESLETEERRNIFLRAEEEDPELRAHLRTFLRAADRIRDTETGLANLSAPLKSSTNPREPWSDEPLDLVGAHLGPYRLESRIGRGGMGEVYRADRFDGELSRAVAVKVLREGMGSRAERLFFEERRILASLEHPHIARLYDAGHTPEGLPYLVMELVQGDPIDRHCHCRSYSLSQRLRLMIQVCEAVAYAHRQMILHLDLKPDNILVEPAGRPKLLDFGISRWLTGSDKSDDNEAPEAYTPGFGSPEQENPQLGAPGAASDVFSLGRVLQCLLQDVPRPDSLPLDLRLIVRKATRENPDERYRSPLHLAEDLKRFLDRQPISLRERDFLYVMGRFLSRRRVAVGLLVPLLLWVSSSLVILFTQRSEILHQRDRARAMASEAEEERRTVLRLADIYNLRQLEAEAEKLWPIHPKSIPALEAWLGSARTLLDRVNLHRATLEDVRSRLGRGGEEAGTETRSQLKWQASVLQNLVSTLESWSRPDGLPSRVADRLRRSETLERRSLGAFREEWQRTIEWLAEPEPRAVYGPLAFKPQLGLVPLGPDPASGLLEVAVVGTGELPTRDPSTGRLRRSEEFAVILVLLPGGPFLMGSQGEDPRAPNYDPEAQWSRDFPQDPVTVKVEPFFMSKFELTQGQWAAITSGLRPSRHDALAEPEEGDESAGQNHPVEQISWQETYLWLSRYGLRLPSEAEWEYAARAGTATPWWSGSESSSLNGVANVADLHLKEQANNPQWKYSTEIRDNYSSHAPVGSFRANAFGLHDIHGNVWEWCEGSPEVSDSYASTPEARFARGGSWWYTAPYAKVTMRIFGNDLNTVADLGARPTRSLDP